ncbi:MAG: hypothetical protein BGO39_10450 [Chloroflexi bacterium 54-19]|nr:MAG: hypothetical protein BGO39_10450 [Chloroflexi bacterium 54-19]
MREGPAAGCKVGGGSGSFWETEFKVCTFYLLAGFVTNLSVTQVPIGLVRFLQESLLDLFDSAG